MLISLKQCYVYWIIFYHQVKLQKEKEIFCVEKNHSFLSTESEVNTSIPVSFTTKLIFLKVVNSPKLFTKRSLVWYIVIYNEDQVFDSRKQKY